MSNLSSLSLLSNEIVYAAGWTIIHSLWQCCLIALIIALSYAFTKKTQASTRYWINAMGLASCLFTSAFTFYLNFHGSLETTIGDGFIKPVNGRQQIVYVRTTSDIINQHIHHIVFCWIIGFGLYIAKYLADFFYCQHIKYYNNRQPSDSIQHLFDELKINLGITKNIQLRISKVISIPCVIGHIKPVVLLPASLVLGVSVKHIEVILLHELGHVRRNDYLINSLQRVTTLLYFFNPFARWISSKMGEERENACDDIAVSISGDPMFYANTLREFAEMKNMCSPSIAMTGERNLLLNRIKRLFIKDTSFVKAYGKASAIMGIFLLTIGYAIAGHSDAAIGSKNSFTIKMDNEPLSNLVEKAEQQCSINIETATLKHMDQSISGNFSDLQCDNIGNYVNGLDHSLDSTLTGISIDEKEIALKNLLEKIESYCPEIKRVIHLNNPDTLVGFKVNNLSCNSAEFVIQKLDTNQKGTSLSIGEGQIDNITFSDQGPDEYDKTFFKEFYPPKELYERGYAGNCILTMDVDTNGYATNINPDCKSSDVEQRIYLENLISERAKQTKFPVKMKHEQAVAAKDIAIRVVWRNKI